MGTTRKVLKKVAIKVEASAYVYGAPDTLLPWTEFTVKAVYDMVQDDSIIGVAWRGLPNQGYKTVEGTLAGYLDVLTSEVLLEAAFGANSSKTYTLPTTENAKTFSMAAVDEVKTYLFTGCVIKKFTITSKTGERLAFSADVLAYTKSRDDSAYPTINVNPGAYLLHRQASGTGYMRIGDQTDALAAGDNQYLDELEISFSWNFDHQFDNSGQTTKQFVSGQGGRPEAEMKAVLSRHDSDTPLTWRDSRTALQAEFYWYSSATANLKIQVANFVNQVDVGDDDLPKVSLDCGIYRNGVSTSYDNANMAWNSPVRAILDNA